MEVDLGLEFAKSTRLCRLLNMKEVSSASAALLTFVEEGARLDVAGLVLLGSGNNACSVALGPPASFSKTFSSVTQCVNC